MRTLDNTDKICGRNKEQLNVRWSFNMTTNQYICSDSFLNICGVSLGQTTPFDFLLLVHHDHRSRVRRAMLSLGHKDNYKDKFPVLTKYGYRWVVYEFMEREITENGDVIVKGCADFLSDDDVIVAKNRDVESRMNELINRYVSVSSSLMELLHLSETSTAILKTLDNLVDDLDGDRAYIFEYDLGQNTQSCIYEVVRNAVRAEKDELQNIPLSSTKWWTEMLYNRRMPVVCGDIEDLPKDEYEILKSQHIESVLVVPLFTKNGVGGYLGIDTVGRKRKWTDTDRQWFQSIGNIISLCIELKKSEDRAQQDRAKYIRLYESMPIGFMRLKMIYDEQANPVNYQVLDVNSVTKELVKYSDGDFVGRMANEIDADHYLERLPIFDNLVKTRGVSKGDSFFEKTQGYFDYTIYSVDKDELIVLLQDNSASVLANRALRKSEETLKNIYKNIPVGIEIYDKDGNLLSVNEAEKDIFGYSSEDVVLGVNLFENPNVPRSFINDLKEGKPAWCDFFYDFDKLDNYYDSTYSGKKHIVLKGSILYDVDNNIENYLLIVLDNTDYLRASHKIEEFELLFNSVAEFAEVGLCQWNPCDNTITGTDQWYDNLNLKNRNITDIMDAYVNGHEADVQQIAGYFEKMIDGNIDSFREEVRIKEGNDWKWLRCNYKLVEYAPEDNRIEIIGINIDITELKNTETKLIEAKHKAEESDRLKSAFLANMSHEIRTPLNAIVGFSDLLIDAEDISDRQQYMYIIRQNNELLLQLISDILDISKIESGTLDIKTDLIDVNGLCNEVMHAQSMRLEKDIKIEFEPEQEECYIISDKNRVTQVLSNLVSNAIKFTQYGTVTIGYAIKGEDIEFFVRDSGIGIPPEQLKMIFNRFVKLNNFASGTGLGLPICKSIIEKMQGRIWAESEVGVGACFKFTLPYDRQDRSDNDVSFYYSNKLNTLKHKDMEDDRPTILVAEDTDSNYLLVSTILKNSYNLIRAYNGLEAIQLFEAHAPKLILMDMKMPEMDGVEATLRIKKIDKSIPIIMLTAFAYDDDRRLALEAGCSDFITKPIHPNELQDVIKKYL